MLMVLFLFYIHSLTLHCYYNKISLGTIKSLKCALVNVNFGSFVDEDKLTNSKSANSNNS